jgi:serine/threonine protein kinase
VTALSDGALRNLRDVIDRPELPREKYRVVAKVASGGMGVIYRAEDLELGRAVAVKVMHAALESGALASRMLGEARIVARLEHPGIVPIHDVGVLPDGRPFYVMKFVSGRRMDEVVRAGAPRHELLRLFRTVCDAIGFAHSQGIIHRDLKPENVMVGAFGEVLVMDWGVAKVLRSAASAEAGGAPGSVPFRSGLPGETAAGMIVGTPPYMAPEQASGDSARHSERSDTFGLGALLCFLLTSAPPPDVLRDPALFPEILRARLGEVPRPLREICLKAMAADPAGRFPDARALSEDVGLFLNGQAVAAYRENPAEKAVRWLSKHSFIVWLILAYLLMRAALLIFTSL